MFISVDEDIAGRIFVDCPFLIQEAEYSALSRILLTGFVQPIAKFFLRYPKLCARCVNGRFRVEEAWVAQSTN